MQSVLCDPSKSPTRDGNQHFPWWHFYVLRYAAGATGRALRGGDVLFIR